MLEETKQLIKYSAFLKTLTKSKFKYKPLLDLKSSSLHCLETLIVLDKKTNIQSICKLSFDCNKGIIYIEDFGKVYSSLNYSLDENLNFKSYFKEVMDDFIMVLSNYKNKLPFKSMIVTTSIYLHFDFLIDLGFKQKEQLNHYGNTKFQLILPK